MSEYIKKLAQIKKDIGIIQDSIFFELHNLEKENAKLKEQLAELRLSIPHIDKTKDSYISRIQKANEILESIRKHSVVYTPIHKVIEAVINILNNEQQGRIENEQ
jgi:hypothetical protein